MTIKIEDIPALEAARPLIEEMAAIAVIRLIVDGSDALVITTITAKPPLGED